MATQLQKSLIRLENFQKLTELQRDLIGVENLSAPGRVSTQRGKKRVEKKGANTLKCKSFFFFGLFVFLGVCTRGLPLQTYQERSATKDVFSGQFRMVTVSLPLLDELVSSFSLLSFQFSDMLLYTSKGVTATNQFKVHGQLPLHGMIVSIQVKNQSPCHATAHPCL